MYIEIVNYDDKYFNEFKRISYNWLDEYNLLEQEDEIILNNPHDYILNNGGIILMANIRDITVGTISLIKRDNNEYEVAKLGVLKEFRNLGVGRRLLEEVINEAFNKDISNIILYTNSKLDAALTLYKHLGFVEVEDKVIYKEADIKMKLSAINRQ